MLGYEIRRSQHDDSTDQWLVDLSGNLAPPSPDFPNYITTTNKLTWHKTLCSDGTFAQLGPGKPNSIRFLADGTVIEDCLDPNGYFGCFCEHASDNAVNDINAVNAVNDVNANRIVEFPDGTVVSQWMTSDGTMANRNWEHFNYRIVYMNGDVDLWMLTSDGTPVCPDQVSVYTRCARSSETNEWQYFDAIDDVVPYAPILH